MAVTSQVEPITDAVHLSIDVAKSGRICGRNSDFWATMFRDFGPKLGLFRIESERLKLAAPFSRRIAEPLRRPDRLAGDRSADWYRDLPRTLRFQWLATDVESRRLGRDDGLNVLKRVQDRFIDMSIGEGAKETTNAILRWLHELIQYIIP
jgi:hypothetical protein